MAYLKPGLVILIAVIVATSADFRLPQAVRPTHYDIRLRTAVHDAEREFQGSVDIHLTVEEPTDKIVVHSRSLTVISAVLYEPTSDPWTEVEQPSHTYDEPTEHLTFQCTTPLQNGSDYVLRVNYSGRLQTELTAGFFRKYYRDNGGIRRYIAATQFRPTWARQTFPCFDEPAIRTTFTVSLIHHSSYNAVSNMPLEGPLVVDTVDPEFVVTTFAQSQPMPTHSLAFAVTDFEIKSLTPQQRALARSNVINDTEYGLTAGDTILLAYNTHFDWSFWNFMPNLVQIAVPDAESGASESWGLVAFGEPTLLFNPEVNDYRVRPAIAKTIAQAYAQQWFGNLVTVDWWNYFWVHQGMAAMYGYYGAQLAYPEDQHMDQFQLQVMQPALKLDASEEARPLNWNVESPVEIAGLFDSDTTRHKAAGVINMLRTVLGEVYWQTGVQKYLRTHELGSVTSEALYEALEETIEVLPPFPTNMTVKQFMDNWADAPGYPVVNVRRLYGTTTMIISQERFLSDKKLPSDYVWYIPYNGLHIPILDFPYHSWLITKSREHIVRYDDEKPFILNELPSVFYRVNYDSRNWELIIAAWVQSPDFTNPTARAQLIDDSFALARADLLDFSVVLRLLTGLKKDRDYLPWATADKVLTYLHDRLRGTDQWSWFVFYMITLVDSNYRTLQFGVVNADDTLNDKQLNELILSWTCRLKIFQCSGNAESMFREAVRADAGVHPDISPVVYCYGARSAVNDEFVWLYQRMFDSQNEAERSLLINAMGCSQSKEQLDAYLTSSIGAGVGSEVNYFDRERLQVVQAVYSASRVGVDALIDFLNNWDMADDFIYWLEQPAFDDAIANIALRTNNQEEFDRLKALFETVGSLAPEDVVSSAMATVKANLDWHDSLEAFIIAEFLERYVYDTISPQDTVT
ncbi:aminopeptidase N-like [Aedes albopictus]|uniref:Aminopeptidase n=1 Tax=Aedes albopictus TaxID=7160 RepID=A0ABM1Y8S3_AEDAL|nr:aminopeptidase N-like [Aedes albopictus]